MGKIRINELARELEVKPNVILDLLPELGVPDKKTHSSSLDDHVVLELRRRLAGGNGAAHAEHEPAGPPPPHPAPAGAPEPVRAEPAARTESVRPEPPAEQN